MDEQQEGFQIATIVAIVAIVVVIMFYLLVFINPQVALNPWKPPAPPTATKPPFPATWTPTPTDTPLPTFTPTKTLPPSLTPLPTAPPTNTPVATATRTRRPIPNTPRPPPPSPYTYRTYKGICEHSGGTYIEGNVTTSQGEEYGVRVRLGTGPGYGEIDTRTTGAGERSPGHYTFVLAANGPKPGTWYVWIVDASGRPISDPNAGRVVTNAIRNADDPGSCWRAEVHFSR